MLVLGHVGIGPRLLGGLRRRLPSRWLILGCLLPDLIDKPLFYALLWSEGHADALISGSRTIGHSGLFWLVLVALALAVRRGWAWAIAAGVLTHLLLDVGGELVAGAQPGSSIWMAIFFPAFGGRFPRAPFHTVIEHLKLTLESGYVICGEIVGGALLLRSWWQRRARHS